MRSLIQEMIHYRNGIPSSEAPDPEKVSSFEKRYREILETAKKEYEYIPPGDYYCIFRLNSTAVRDGRRAIPLLTA